MTKSPFLFIAKLCAWYSLWSNINFFLKQLSFIVGGSFGQKLLVSKSSKIGPSAQKVCLMLKKEYFEQIQV